VADELWGGFGVACAGLGEAVGEAAAGGDEEVAGAAGGVADAQGEQGGLGVLGGGGAV
jgi:hypothetical protein